MLHLEHRIRHLGTRNTVHTTVDTRLVGSTRTTIVTITPRNLGGKWQLQEAIQEELL